MPFAYRVGSTKRRAAKLPDLPFGPQQGKNLTRAGAAFLRGPRFDVQKRGLTAHDEVMPNVVTEDNRGHMVTLNNWESVLFRALTYMHINFQSQAKLGRLNALGSGNVDFLLPDYKMVLDPLGPFHFGLVGQEKDFWRTLTRREYGLINVGMYEWELTSIPVCIRRLTEILAAPMAWSMYSGE